ncbi:hypothetical protein [Phaffia rhodozyma]|uniref:Uncharacterized protein n=1 Tax=Phaffia rhodozyma TaxID=264483 RepID=A0A0F7SRE6_PHARH|nr:hypothetical protein [Phaffia rhodozyma]
MSNISPSHPLTNPISHTTLLEDPRSLRLSFSPTYSVVGIYRLLTDSRLQHAVWSKTKHGTIRGLLVGGFWVFLSWRSQQGFIEKFLMGTKVVTRFAGKDTSVFGYNVPLSLYATIFLLSSQFWYILRFFLSKNISIARARAWSQTVESRGKPDTFWGEYVEEWVSPPMDKAAKARKKAWLRKFAVGYVGKFILHKFVLFPLNFVPFVGIVISSGVKALGTARYLHAPYFASKKMTLEQQEVFVEERKYDYYAFGFTSALLESLPFIGMFFSISNRIGAAMWAFDLEKRQAAFRSGELKPQPHDRTTFTVIPGVGSLGQVEIKSDLARQKMDDEGIPGSFAGMTGKPN